MNKYIIVCKLLNEIKSLFSEVSERMEKHDSVMTTSKMEEFSKLTTEAKEYLYYMLDKLKCANDKEKEFIDIYYVETLLFCLTDNVKKYGWQFITNKLQSPFVNFLG